MAEIINKAFIEIEDRDLYNDNKDSITNNSLVIISDEGKVITPFNEYQFVIPNKVVTPTKEFTVNPGVTYICNDTINYTIVNVEGFSAEKQVSMVLSKTRLTFNINPDNVSRVLKHGSVTNENIPELSDNGYYIYCFQYLPTDPYTVAVNMAVYN